MKCDETSHMDVLCFSQTLNQLAARDRYSGVMMWPGGGFNYRGIVPKFHYAWNMNVSWEKRVDLVMDWLVLVAFTNTHCM